MTHTTHCDREAELHEAVVLDWWPAHVDEELRAHVAECACCRDLLEVAGALRAERAAATAQGRIPPARIVWLRSHLRDREEAVRRATRPITIAHAIAIAVTAVAAWEALRRAVGWAWDARSWLGASLSGVGTFLASIGQSAVAGVTSGSALWLTLLVAAAAAVALAPVAIYLAVSEK